MKRILLSTIFPPQGDPLSGAETTEIMNGFKSILKNWDISAPVYEMAGFRNIRVKRPSPARSLSR